MSFVSVNDIGPREVAPGFIGRFLHSGNISLAYWDAKEGAEIPLHHHVHEMMVNVLSGKLELTIGNESQILEPGIVGVIPSNVPHKAKAITDCRILDVFFPVREDYK